MLALYSTAFVGFGLVDQIRNGIVERLLVTPASRLSILLSLVLRDIAVLVVQSAIALLLAWALGLHAHLGGILASFGLMLLTAMVLASCSYALAMRLKQEDTLASVVNSFATPLLLLSGITLPLTLAPKVIQAIASVNPFAYEVTASRSLFVGNFADSAILVGGIFLAALAALAFWWAIRSFRKAAV